MYQVPEHLFNTPTTIIISGATGSGKTTWLKKVLQNASLFKTKPDRIVYCYGVWQDSFKDMHEVEFRKGLDIPGNDGGDHMIIVLDDLMSQVVQSPSAESLFTEGSHHRNITVIFILQNLFQQGKHARTIMLNSHYIVLFKNPRDIQQVRILGRQLGQEKAVEEAYKDCMKKPYGYLMIDLSPHNTTDDFKLKTDIFPSQDLVIYLPR